MLIGGYFTLQCWDIHEDNKAYIHFMHLRNDKLILGRQIKIICENLNK